MDAAASPRTIAYATVFERVSTILDRVSMPALTPSGIELLERENDRIRLQSRHWLMG